MTDERIRELVDRVQTLEEALADIRRTIWEPQSSPPSLRIRIAQVLAKLQPCASDSRRMAEAEDSAPKREGNLFLVPVNTFRDGPREHPARKSTR